MANQLDRRGDTGGPGWVGVVLAGGASRRMGADKAAMPVGGIPMAQRVAAALRGAGCDPVVLQGGASVAGIDVWPDTEPGAGPVAAIAAALRRAGGPIVVAACDLPHLDTAAVERVIGAAEANPGAAIVVAVAPSGRPALLSVWRPHALDTLGETVGRPYRVVLGHLGAVPVEVPAAAVHNVNSPGDLPA